MMLCTIGVCQMNLYCRSTLFQKMIKTLILIGTLAMAAASSSHAKQDPSCMEAENVTLCEADLPVCKSLFKVDRDEHTRRRIYKTCLDQNGLNHLDDVDPELLFGPTNSEVLSLFGSQENHLAAMKCVVRERGVLRPDGTVNPQPFLETVTLVLNDTRPDILQRVVYAAESYSTENILDWEMCILGECIQVDLATPVPTTVVPEE
ncbi:uncharacterized protein LOC122268108 [Penaeus japonicus]|uniref:uncharacterized protein LOC122268108 n=1 Tax=Penaeus japonicus TaxID=27405 RepID=UPI001C70F5F9|nr:uncharacterized protein LOC122268108 [Penaeus japonicus]